jgi:CheY-like chemotaxis protein/anti-sigma regulatory factor (Ser/Thr protein kinase)
MSEKALAASEAKSAFLSHMSHEIRTPINAILGMNEIILRESRDESITTYASNIKTAGNSLLGLINDILDFSKIEAGKMEIIQIDYDISSVINDLVNLIQSRADAKGLQLLLEIDPNIPKMLHGDEVRIKQVITNILTNAVKYTDKGSITLGLAYEKIPEAPDAIYLDVYIKDTGMGIKSEDLPKLFAEFERIDEEKNRNIEGTGLGMSIIKRLLDMMGSTLKVDSIYGLGSRFSFRLRQKVLKWEPLGDYEAAYRNSLAERGKYREKFIAPKAQVLCVDDNEMNRVVFRSLIKNTLVKSDMAVDGYEALEMSRDKKYDIIFMDYLMPGKDGTETLNDIRKEEENPNLTTPVICLTANAVSGARDEFIAAGFDDYLTKPIDPDVLEHMIMEYLPDELIELTVEGDAEDRKTDHTHPEVPVELEPFTNLDVIDVFRGIKNSGGADLYLNTLKVFYESIDVKVNELNGFYAEKDTYNYRIKVHALKSSLRLIGADGLGEEAQGLEDAAKNQKPDFIAAHHDEFIAKCESLKGPLANVFIKDETEENKIEDDKTEADAGLIADAYKEIREAAEEMSCDKLDEICERMSEYSIPENAAPMWNDVKNAADSFDYQGVLSLLDRLD